VESPLSPGGQEPGDRRDWDDMMNWSWSQMNVNERKKIGRIRAVSCTTNRVARVVESDEQREIRKSVIMAKDARSPLRASGNEWLYCQSWTRAMQAGTNSEQNAIAMIAANSIADLYIYGYI
jgi:hypothetical protein